MTDETVYLERVYYHGVYALIHFIKQDSVDRKEVKADMEEYMYD